MHIDLSDDSIDCVFVDPLFLEQNRVFAHETLIDILTFGLATSEVKRQRSRAQRSLLALTHTPDVGRSLRLLGRWIDDRGEQ
jgi:hypothetical protein